MAMKMATSETATVKALNQKDSFTPNTRIATRMMTVARAMGSMMIAPALLSQAATQNCSELDGKPAGQSST